MHELSGFERRLAAGLDAVAGSPRSIDPIEIARTAASRPAVRRSIVSRIAGVVGERAGGLRARPLVVLIAVALVAALAVGAWTVGSELVRPPSVAPSPPNRVPPTDSPSVPSQAPSTTTVERPDVATPIGGMRTSRETGRAAALLADGRVLVVGGTGQGDASTESEILDPNRGTWTVTGSMQFPRLRGQSLTTLADGRVLVAGGSEYRSGSSVTSPRSEAELYDPPTGTWAETGAMAGTRSGQSAMLLRDGRVLIAGGNTEKIRLRRVAEIYDPDTGTWTTTDASPLHRLVRAALLNDGRVLALGVEAGCDLACAQSRPMAAVVYDPDANAWTDVADPTSSGCAFNQLIPLGTGEVLSLCGTVYDDDPRVAELYDPVRDTWSTAASPPRPLTGAAVLLQDGRVLVTDTQAGALYQPASGAWQRAALPDVQQLPGQWNPDTATVLADGRVLLTMGTSIFLYTPPAP
jgi:hypothetical protein